MRIKSVIKNLSYILSTGYVPTEERVNPDFPDENFQNHLKVYRFASQFAGGGDVLDVGCGTGYGTAILKEVARSVVGVDRSRSALRWARKHYPAVDYRLMDVHRLEFPDESFDFILSSENFEHLADQTVHVAELARVLRPTGLCLVGSPNPEMFIGNYNPYHVKENTYAELEALFSTCFAEVSILNNTAIPPSALGREQRAERLRNAPSTPELPFPTDNTWLHNTHSFLCFLRKPLRNGQERLRA
jgi:SAM-dependent methyltransferase